MAGHAAAFAQARALKLKLTGDADLDAARVRAVRARCPDPWIGVDANQGHGAATLPALLPALVEARVSLLEQPCARGREDALDGIERVLHFAAHGRHWTSVVDGKSEDGSIGTGGRRFI